MNKVLNDDIYLPNVYYGTTPWGNYLGVINNYQHLLYQTNTTEKWQKSHRLEDLQFICNIEDMRSATKEEHQLYYDMTGIGDKYNEYCKLVLTTTILDS